MTPLPASISAITGRMRQIDARFDRAEPTIVVTTGDPFDPFGEAYQRALEQRPASGSSASATDRLPAVARPIESASAWPAVTGSDRPHRTGGIVVPPELAAYGNGRIPTTALQPIDQAGHRLWGPAAAAWDAVVDAAAADGIDLRITDSFRTFDQQVDLARRKGLYRDGGLAAVPGTSNHGWGLAVDADVTDARTLQWLRDNGPSFGWVESVPREPWHWEYRPPTS